MTWRAATANDRRLAWLWALAVVLAIAFVPVWRVFAALMPPCAWHHWTGIACPSCGATRAFLRLSRLDLGGALRFNPLAVTAGLAFCAVGLAAPLWLVAGGSVPVPAPGPKPRWAAAFALVVGVNWIWLIVHGV